MKSILILFEQPADSFFLTHALEDGEPYIQSNLPTPISTIPPTIAVTIIIVVADDDLYTQ